MFLTKDFVLEGKVVCSFFGHRDSPWTLYDRLVDEIDALIKRGVTDFIVGNQGNFDSMAIKALRELKQRYPFISFTVVLAYVPGEKRESNPDYQINSIVPCDIEKVPKRFAISHRNRWMVRKSDVVICYVLHSWGGAAQSVKCALNQGKEIINIAKEPDGR